MMVDITRELISTPPYPGDAAPRLTVEKSFSAGDRYRLSRIDMSLHAATHLDAPLHFLEEGADIASTPLSLYSGSCCVLPAEAVDTLSEAAPRLLLRGEPCLTPARIEKLLSLGVLLIGVESMSVGTAENELETHTALLKRGVALLENIDLAAAPDGLCRLCAFPLKIRGAEAAPCRAVLFYDR